VKISIAAAIILVFTTGSGNGQSIGSHYLGVEAGAYYPQTLKAFPLPTENGLGVSIIHEYAERRFIVSIQAGYVKYNDMTYQIVMFGEEFQTVTKRTSMPFRLGLQYAIARTRMYPFCSFEVGANYDRYEYTMNASPHGKGENIQFGYIPGLGVSYNLGEKTCIGVLARYEGYPKKLYNDIISISVRIKRKIM
jgi:hypothetical protein